MQNSSFPEAGAVIRGAQVGRAAFDTDLARHLALPVDVAERLRVEAQSAGYAVGWAQGRQEAEVRARAERDQLAAETRQAIAAQEAVLTQALSAVADSVTRLEGRLTHAVQGLEDEIVAAAFELAQAIVGRELSVVGEAGSRATMARALALAPAGRPAVVKLSPADAALLAGTSTVDGREISVIADASLQPGDAVVECDATTVDARLAAAVQRAKETLA